MTTTNANPNDTFWLARYAHNTLTPAIESLPGQTDKVYAYLYLGLTAHPLYPGLHVWVHYSTPAGGGIVDSESNCVSQAAIDRIAANLSEAWADVPAVKAWVTA